jgi:hypothetical protein
VVDAVATRCISGGHVPVRFTPQQRVGAQAPTRTRGATPPRTCWLLGAASPRAEEVDTGPDAPACTVDRPPRAPPRPGRPGAGRGCHVRVASDGRGGWGVAGSVADLEQPGSAGGRDGDVHGATAMPQRIGCQLLGGEKEPFDGALVGVGRAGSVVQGDRERVAVRGQVREAGGRLPLLDGGCCR